MVYEKLQNAIMAVLPDNGQFAFMLFPNVRSRMGYHVSWEEFQEAFDELYSSGHITSKPNLEESIVSRIYPQRADRS
jgi:hypothetical protein